MTKSRKDRTWIDVPGANGCFVFLGKGGLLHHVHSVPIFPCLHILAFGKITSFEIGWTKRK